MLWKANIMKLARIGAVPPNVLDVGGNGCLQQKLEVGTSQAYYGPSTTNHRKK